MQTILIPEDKFTAKPEPERIFRDDELSINQLDPTWDKEKLLEQRGLFLASHILPLLGIRTTRIRKIRKSYGTNWQLCYGLTGVRKIWHLWYVNMSMFAGFYIEFIEPELIAKHKASRSRTIG